MANDMPIRVLHVVYQMNRGGMETCIMQFLRRMDPARFSLDFVVHTDEPGEYDDEIRARGGSIHVNPPPRAWRAHRQGFRRTLQDGGPYDVVHAHDMVWGPLLAVAHAEEVPVRIIHSHNDVRWHQPASLLERVYCRCARRASLRHATHGLAVSEVAAEAYFGRKWKRDNRWRVLVSGRDFSPFHEAVDREAMRAELGLPADARVIGHVGSLTEQKNHRFWLQIAGKLARMSDRYHFLLVGDGPLRAGIVARAEELGLSDRLVLAGVRDDVPRVLGAMDLFLFPSFYEGLPGAVVEAQAAGLPCLISDAITSETQMIPELVTRLELDDGPGAWAQQVEEQLQEHPGLPREDACEHAKESQFDMVTHMRRLSAVYNGRQGKRSN